MATTDTTSILSIDPLQETFDCYQDHHPFQVKPQASSSSSSKMANTTSTQNQVTISPNSTLSSSSSSSSMRNSRLSLPSLWNSGNGGYYSAAPLDSSSSTSSLWSYSLGDLSSSNTTITGDKNQDKNGLDDLHQRQSSLDSLGRYRLNSYFNHSAPPPFLDQSKKQQWNESANNVYGQHSTNTDVDWLAPSNYTTSCHPLRSIWSISAADQQQPSQQRRMSLSSDGILGNPSLSDAHHRNLDDMYSYGRRHSLGGPLINKSPTHSNSNAMNTRQSCPGIIDSMNAIDEFDISSYSSAKYSRQRQLELNKKILDHIDEYFGGNNIYNGGGHGDSPFCTGTTTTSAILAPNVQQCDISAPMGSYANNTGKTMTAGGDAANFGSSTVLMGKGIPLHHFLNSNTMLYNVEFKAGRVDTCYIMEGDQVLPKIGDLVIVEADRGHDLGKVKSIMTANDILHHNATTITTTTDDKNMGGDDDMKKTVSTTNNNKLPTTPTEDDDLVTGAQKLYVKRLHRLADAEEAMSLATKRLDEEKALMVCQAKVQQKELPMQVVDAEYQWDRRKLTYYFLAEQRIDFRELVRELFKKYKTRIWMCAVKSDSNDSRSCE